MANNPTTVRVPSHSLAPLHPPLPHADVCFYRAFFCLSLQAVLRDLPAVHADRMIIQEQI